MRNKGTLKWTETGLVFPITKIRLEKGGLAIYGRLPALSICEQLCAELPYRVELGHEVGIFDPDGNLFAYTWGGPSTAYPLYDPNDAIDQRHFITVNSHKRSDDWYANQKKYALKLW